MEKISVQVEIDAKIDKVWQHWNDPKSITGWAFASDTWECPHAENDLRLGGRFLMRMSAKVEVPHLIFVAPTPKLINFAGSNTSWTKQQGSQNRAKSR